MSVINFGVGFEISGLAEVLAGIEITESAHG
jgi:hypothetical protein